MSFRNPSKIPENIIGKASKTVKDRHFLEISAHGVENTIVLKAYVMYKHKWMQAEWGAEGSKALRKTMEAFEKMLTGC